MLDDAPAQLPADAAEERAGAEVCEITDLVECSGWSRGMRLVARRQYPNDGARMSFTDIAGRRYRLFHTGAVIALSGRRTRLRLASAWRWSSAPASSLCPALDGGSLQGWIEP